ncbi:MAG: LCP family protein [Abditibacteriota bacterium]|nr:LCP family protein [Abditibacteriota bacterium]
MSKKSWIGVILAVIIGCGVGVFVGTFIGKWSTLLKGENITAAIKPAFGGRRCVRILMIGEDNTGENERNGLSDTIVVFSLDTKTKEIRAVSIPRDTMVEMDGKTCKINAANVMGGSEKVVDTVEHLLLADTDYYVKTTTSGLRELVDLLGGVYIKIDKNMRYTDRRGGLYINLKASPEKQLLNGKDAEGYVRFRHDAYGDSGFRIEDGEKVAAGRIVRQQIFMRALANRILALPSKADRAKILQTALDKKYIESDLTLKDWNELADLLKDFDPATMDMTVLPGEPGFENKVSYWIPDKDAIPDVVSKYLYFEGETGTKPAEKVKVEVLNGSGVAGVARLAGSSIEKAGHEVVRVDNADTTDEETTVITVYNDKRPSAEEIQKRIKCGVIRELKEKNEDFDVSVLVGKDFDDRSVQ